MDRTYSTHWRNKKYILLEHHLCILTFGDQAMGGKETPRYRILWEADSRSPSPVVSKVECPPCSMVVREENKPRRPDADIMYILAAEMKYMWQEQ
jgi:hypothetical protein